MGEEPSYMPLQDWILYNLRVYAAKVGFDDPAMNNALVYLSKYAWDQLMLAEVGEGGELFVNELLNACMGNPYTRDEEEWDEHAECVAKMLKPFVDALREHLENLHEKIREAAREAAGILTSEGDG